MCRFLGIMRHTFVLKSVWSYWIVEKDSLPLWSELPDLIERVVGLATESPKNADTSSSPLFHTVSLKLLRLLFGGRSPAVSFAVPADICSKQESYLITLTVCFFRELSMTLRARYSMCSSTVATVNSSGQMTRCCIFLGISRTKYSDLWYLIPEAPNS